MATATITTTSRYLNLLPNPFSDLSAGPVARTAAEIADALAELLQVAKRKAQALREVYRIARGIPEKPKTGPKHWMDGDGFFSSPLFDDIADLSVAA